MTPEHQTQPVPSTLIPGNQIVLEQLERAASRVLHRRNDEGSGRWVKEICAGSCTSALMWCQPTGFRLHALGNTCECCKRIWQALTSPVQCDVTCFIFRPVPNMRASTTPPRHPRSLPLLLSCPPQARVFCVAVCSTCDC